MKVYKSFEDAHKSLLLLGDPASRVNLDSTLEIDNLKFTQCQGSYDSLQHGGNIINFVGIGPKRSEGRPSGNYNSMRQNPFYHTRESRKAFPVLVKNNAGLIVCLGIYEIVDITKKVSNEGFSYFNIRLQRIHTLSKKLMNEAYM